MPPLPAAAHGARTRGQAGFTLIELAVTTIVVVEIALAALLLFDASGKLSKAEMQVADMQQSLRIGQYQVVKYLRMAGRGELPVANLPGNAFQANLFSGTSLVVRNNVPGGSGVIAGQSPTDPPSTLNNPRVLTGTDVLTVRGVFSTPLYQINFSDPTTFTFNKLTGTGTVKVSSNSPTGVPQPFDAACAPGSFADAISNHRPEALILVSSVDDTIYGVAQLDYSNSNINGTAPSSCPPPPSNVPQTATLAFTTANAGTTGLSANGGFPTAIRNVAYVGILEEYRFYVREVHAKPSDLTSEVNPRLSRGRFYAGTDSPWNADVTNLYQDIAEGVLDLQIALGFDLSAGPNYVGVVQDSNSSSDMVLFNSPQDSATSAPWSPVANPFPPLLWVRVDVLARTNRHDLQYRAPIIASVEDHVYTASPGNPWDPNGTYGLTMRRRLSQTVVGIRNRI
jgi:Type IV Pilus-assembly protein W